MAKLSKKAIREANMNRLAELFDANMGDMLKLKSSYYVEFDNGITFLISEDRESFDKNLERIINVYENFRNNKAEFVKVIENRIEKDNIIATEKGFKTCKVLDVDYVRTKSNLGRFYIKMDIDGTVKNFTELLFNLSMDSIENLEDEFSSRQTYETAPLTYNADFIFNNRGYEVNSTEYEI